MKAFTQKTLSELIRQRIAKRIAFSAVFLTLFFIALTAYDLSKVFSDMSKDLNKTTKELSELIISQSLIYNEKTLKFSIEGMKFPDGYHVKWIKDKSSHQQGFLMKSLLSWQYIYPVNGLDHKYFGIIEINGNLSENHAFFREFWIRIASLLVGIVIMSFLLLPLSNKIPNDLFVIPINYLLSLLRQKNTNIPIKIEKNIGSEIREVIDNVVDLVEKEKKDSAMNTTNLLAQKMIHDIRSPLSVLDMTLLDIKKYVPEFEYSLLTEAIQSVKDTSNNLFLRYRENIEQNDISEELILDHGNNENIISLQNVIETVVIQKRQEWRNEPCNLIVKIEENTQCYRIKAIPNEVKRLLSNILNNAYEAIQDRREIFIELMFEENKGTLNLTIRDFGTGIPEDKINDVLSGMSLKHKGDGIGLSSAVKYMKTLHGNLEITSKIEEGTCVKLHFPIFV